MRDHSRFRKIVRGQIKSNLKKFVSHQDLITQQGKKKLSVKLPSIELPRFKFGGQGEQGVGSGEGEEGDPIDGKPGEGEPGQGKAGEGKGDHALEVEFTIDELAEILGEELELPAIEPKGVERLTSESVKYSGVQKNGPESLRHFKRTFKQALRRQISMGVYNAKSPAIVPIKDDKRYRSWKVHTKPQTNAVIIYMMDVSGSMGEQQKEIVRIESFWIDAWLQKQYSGIETRFIIHDAIAREVDKDTFFRTRESGGTMISSAYKLALDIIEKDYPASEWNIYPFHFSDGDNWSSEDTKLCIDLLKNKMLPQSNAFFYGQVESPYGSGQFIKDITTSFDLEKDRIITSEISGKDKILDSIKTFLSKGY